MAPRTLLGCVAAYFVVAGLSLFLVEGWNAIDSCYFLVVSMTTVGYGDVVPESGLGKLLACVFVVAGLGVVACVAPPLLELITHLVDMVDARVARFLENHKFAPAALADLDGSLSVQDVNDNANFSYVRRCALAAIRIACVLLVGLILSPFIIDTGDGIDAFYWALTSLTTVGYGDVAPQGVLAKLLTMLYLPVALAVVAEALWDVRVSTVRRGIRESDYGGELIGDCLAAECVRHGSSDESLVESDFVLAVLRSKQLIDDDTIRSVRQQFRQMARKRGGMLAEGFDCASLFELRVKRGDIKQRAADKRPGTMKEGQFALVDLSAADSGFAEWRKHFWDPIVEKDCTGTSIGVADAAADMRQRLTGHASPRSGPARGSSPRAPPASDEDFEHVGVESMLDAGCCSCTLAEATCQAASVPSSPGASLADDVGTPVVSPRAAPLLPTVAAPRPTPTRAAVANPRSPSCAGAAAAPLPPQKAELW